MRPFRCPVTILNTIDHLGKFNGKADEGFFVGYSLNSKAFKVFNSRTRMVEENLHIRFSENTPNVVGTKTSDNEGQSRKETEPIKDYILLPLWTADSPSSQDLKSSHDDGSKPSSDDGKKYCRWKIKTAGRFKTAKGVSTDEDKDFVRNSLEEMKLETTQTSTTAKLPMLKQGDYEMRRLRIEQYFKVQDYALWEVIESRNSYVSVTQTTTAEGGVITTTKSTSVTAKERLKKKNDVIVRKTRFGGNEATKKTQKTLLKQMYENFNASSTQSLDSIFNRLQKLVSQLAVLDVFISQEDLSLKFLRSLHFKWNTHVVVWRNKPDLDIMSIDDLYNNFKIVKQEKTGKKITINGSDTAGFDKTKVECYNCHKMRHFARECRGPRNQDSKNRYQDSSRRSVNVEKPPSKAMVVIDEVSFDWSYMAEDEVPTNMALMAFLDSEVQTNNTCLKTRLKGYETLKKQNDDLKISLNKAEFDLVVYKRSLASVKEQLVFYKNNETTLCENIVVLTRDMSFKDSEINVLKNELEKVKQEKESIQLKIEKFDNASKSLDNLLGSQITDKSKQGLGFQSYNVVPAPSTLAYNIGRCLPPKVDLSFSGLEEFKQPEFKSYETKPCKVELKSVSKSVDVKHTEGNEPKITKKENRAPIIQDWVSNNENEDEPPIGQANTARPKAVNTARLCPPVVNAVRAKQVNVVKASTWNMSHLSDFKEFNRGYVALGEEQIMAELLMCDRKSNVLFTDTECLVLSPNFKLPDESQILLRVPRKNNMRLGHINFKNINKLVKDNLVRGLPSKRFENEQTCVDCLKGKQYKASLSSFMHKNYGLVVIDDYSRHTWVFFLATKDETKGILKKLITEIENLVDKKVKVIRCDNGTEFKNIVMNDFGALKVKPQNKTPYDMFRGRTPALSFMRPFSKAFRVYNIRTRKVEENLHVEFLENKSIVEGDGPKWLFDIDMLTKSMNYVPVIAGTNSNDFADGSPLFDTSSKDSPIAGFKPLEEEKKQDDKDPGNEDNKVPRTKEPKADMTNLDTHITVSPIATTKIHKNHPLKQMDVKSTFLYRRIKEEAYVCQPSRFEDPDHPDKELCTAFEKLMKDKFQMSSMGELTFFIGLQVKQKEYGIFISKDKYVDEILRKSMIGSLMYLTTSRPDIMYVVSVCARFQVTPKISHLHDVKRIFKYLKGQPKLGLWYPRDSPFELVAYTDSNYAGASLDRRPTTGGCQFLGIRLISWHCKKQTVVATSTTKAEYVAAAKFCGKHNMVAYLTKPTGSEGFQQIVDFLNGSHIMYALTKNPTIYVSLIKQFWQTATARTLDNEEIEITATIDGKAFTVTEASVRIHLQLADVDDEDVNEEMDDRVESCATTAASLDAELVSGNITRTESTVILNMPLPQETGAGGRPSFGERLEANKGSLWCSFYKAYHKGRKIEEIDQDLGISMVQHDAEDQGRFDDEFGILSAAKVLADAARENVQTYTIRRRAVRRIAVNTGSGGVILASRLISTAEESVSTMPVSTAGMDIKDKEKGIMEEAKNEQTKKTNRQKEQERLGYEAAVRLQEELDEEERQRIAREEKEKYSEVDQAKMLVDLINQRKKYFAAQKAEEKRKKPMTQAQQRTYMSNYIKQMGSHTLSQLKKLSFDELKKLFETTMKRVSTFVPMEIKVRREVPEIAARSSKRDAKEELTQESSKRQRIEEGSE
nr:uncharacterized mitochondrial protein AtMg00810-like [Tanacetum cinerariifolium]